MRRFAWLLVVSFCLALSISVVNAQSTTCPGSLPPRLVVGGVGRVTPGDANNVRSEASSAAELTGQIPAGESFNVLDGPICNNDRTWWKIEYQGLVGWTVEGSAESYWLEPVEQTPLPSETEASVEDAVVPISAMTPENLTQYTRRPLDFTSPVFAGWSPDGRWLVVHENDGIWVVDRQADTGATLLVRQVDTQNGSIIGILYDGSILLFANRGQLFAINPESGERREIALSSAGSVVTLSPDGTILLYYNLQDKTISLLDLQTN
jgi:uncharacterized protein YraI